MGLAKKDKATTNIPASIPVAETPKVESGIEAALERLKKTPEETKTTVADKPAYKSRDFDKEARGKTRCAMYAAALQSPALAGLQFNTIEEFLKLVEKAADAGVTYSFSETK